MASDINQTRQVKFGMLKGDVTDTGSNTAVVRFIRVGG